jgi:hypothetical protein
MHFFFFRRQRSILQKNDIHNWLLWISACQFEKSTRIWKAGDHIFQALQIIVIIIITITHVPLEMSSTGSGFTKCFINIYKFTYVR